MDAREEVDEVRRPSPDVPTGPREKGGGTTGTTNCSGVRVGLLLLPRVRTGSLHPDSGPGSPVDGLSDRCSVRRPTDCDVRGRVPRHVRLPPQGPEPSHSASEGRGRERGLNRGATWSTSTTPWSSHLDLSESPVDPSRSTPPTRRVRRTPGVDGCLLCGPVTGSLRSLDPARPCDLNHYHHEREKRRRLDQTRGWGSPRRPSPLPVSPSPLPTIPRPPRRTEDYPGSAHPACCFTGSGSRRAHGPPLSPRLPRTTERKSGFRVPTVSRPTAPSNVFPDDSSSPPSAYVDGPDGSGSRQGFVKVQTFGNHPVPEGHPTYDQRRRISVRRRDLG